MKTAIMKNIITGVEKKVHLTKDHPAVQCGPFYVLSDIKEE